MNADKNTVPDHDALGYASGIQLENGGAPAFIKKPARTKYENILSDSSVQKQGFLLYLRSQFFQSIIWNHRVNAQRGTLYRDNRTA